MNSEKTRGFITIATGNEAYYKLARNLMKSYRFHSESPLPFAILCDHTNEYTESFDKVIIIEDPTYSFLDKLKMYQYLPYDETIFIDADTMAYSDLNIWWDTFEKGSSFSAFGVERELGSGNGWFDPEKTGIYRDTIEYIPDFCGGVYYIEKDEISSRVFSLATEFALHYREYGFKRAKHPVDEACFSLAMAICKCKCHRNMVTEKYAHTCNLPATRHVTADISKPVVYYHNGEQNYQAEALHFGNVRTHYSLYRFQKEYLDRLIDKNTGFMTKLFYEWKLRFYILRVLDVMYLPSRIKRRLKLV